jgi:hypothetical protein
MRKNFKRTAFIILLIPILFFFYVFSTADIEGENELIPSLLNSFTRSKVNSQAPQRVYVAASLAECGSFTPCYTNTNGLDGPNGTGTGLRDAVNALNPGDEIVVLGNYLVKDHTVLIDKALTIQGQNNSLITYNGTNCSVPMLNFTAGGILKDLTIAGVDCSGVSRDLVSINSQVDLRIEHNTLTNGGRAVDIKSGDSTVTLAFNHITGNQDYALYQGMGLGSGIVKIFANNIHSNRTDAQVNCNNLGSADHNFWGEGVLASSGAEFCTVSDAKTLGAPILTETNAPGVQALMQNVTDTFAAAFENNIAVKRNSGGNYDLVIVNHGQGTTENIPFLGVGTTPIIACSNIYDIFLAEGAVASDLVLSIKYDLNADCISAMESVDFCGSSDSSKIPLWWYDPLNNLTDGWDRTGQIPAGYNPLNENGQLTSCNTAEDSLQVLIDTSGRPGISKDLNFTPFLAGLPIGSSDIKTFGAVLDIDEVDLSWETGIESSISGYHVLRASSETGPYSRISAFISAIGSNALYQYTDVLNTTDFNKNFYYKIEIINIYGDTIRTHGPQSILTSTPTPTFTPTKTSTPTRTLYPTRTPYPTSTPGPTRTATLYYYRSPTSYYRPRTSTPFNTPTQVRTDRPLGTEVSPTITEIPPSDHSLSPVFITGTLTKSRSPLPTNTIWITPTPTQVPPQEPGLNDQAQNPLVYLLIGSFSGLAFLGLGSFLLFKTYF